VSLDTGTGTMTDRLLEAMRGSAARSYGGESVTELSHALQCADLARAAGVDEELQLACLLHDVGRYAVDQTLIVDKKHTTATRTDARSHSDVGADLIAPWVPERVAWCVRMHAQAKRYLCALEPAYHDRLSPGSKRTLVIQGGVMTPGEADGFATHPWAQDALTLRRWDDQAKIVNAATSVLDDWTPLLRRYFDRAPYCQPITS
jgi:predicted HD phosphohydrolase